MRHGQEPLIFDKVSAVDFFDPSGEAESWLRWGRFSGFFWFPSSFCVLYILLDSLNVFTGFRLFADTVVKILGHATPRRAWCHASVVCSLPAARDSRLMSRAIRPAQHHVLRTRYTRFCLVR